MQRILASLICTLFLLIFSMQPAQAQYYTKEYLAKYFTNVAAASCLGSYLPDNSTELGYLYSYGWDIMPRTYVDGKVESNFILATNYLPEIDKQVYLVTFRGSKSKKDWGINLTTSRVKYGGSILAEMRAVAQEKFAKTEPAVHGGFHAYVDKVLEHSVLDAQGNFCGVFKEAVERKNGILILTGHSLGGAIATLLGERLLDLGFPPEKLHVLTFGAPALANAAFGEQYGERLPLLRITATADPVPGSLQTFFGGYKQFGKYQEYAFPLTLSNMQHDMAMYFDYSMSEYFAEYDKQVDLGALNPEKRSQLTQSVPMVALWVLADEDLEHVAQNANVKRFVVTALKRRFPSFVVLGANAGKKYSYAEISSASAKAGADYVLICTLEGERPRKDAFWYLTLEATLLDKQGKLLQRNLYAKKVEPSLGNMQALGASVRTLQADLQAQLSFMVKPHKAQMVP